MEKKKIILIVASVIILLFSGVLITNTIIGNDKNNSTIINKKLLKDKKIDNLLIKDIEIITTDESSTYTAVVENKENKEKEITLNITFYENEKEIKVLALYKRKISAKGQTDIDITFNTDLKRITKIEYSLE